MSGIDFSCESATGGGNLYYDNTIFKNKDKNDLANLIAGEIVNEIIENALDIAVCANETGVNWKEIKDSFSNTAISEASSNLNNNVTNLNKTEEVITEKSSVVGDILNAEDKLIENMTDPLENLNQVNQGGIGDQPKNDKVESMFNEHTLEPKISRTLGKRSRVIDLVKNAPQLITEYLKKDKNSKLNQDEWEEAEEKIVQVIELDHVKPEDMYDIIKRAENTVLPDDDEHDLVEIPSDDKMEIIDLSSGTCKKEEQKQLSSTLTKNNTGAKGDDLQATNVCETTLEIITNISESEQKVIPQLNTYEEIDKPKKKKWKLGIRFWRFIKKGNKEKMRSSSTT